MQDNTKLKEERDFSNKQSYETIKQAYSSVKESRMLKVKEERKKKNRAIEQIKGVQVSSSLFPGNFKLLVGILYKPRN